MSLSTKRGDDGSTSLLFGKRVSKTHPRVMTYGRVDELSSALGLCRAHCRDAATQTQLLEIQKQLIQMMAELATDEADQPRYHEKHGEKAVQSGAVEALGALVIEKEKDIRFDGWTYAGESIAEAFFDQARTTCRRAERGLVALKESGATVRPELIQYLNRLADLLWLWAKEN
jgi:cob(I)alamin adenosyltransferase